jgi:ABC-type Co2+ transport system permease subunit
MDPTETLRLATEATANQAAFYAFWGLVVQAIATTIVALAGPWFAYRLAVLSRDMKTLEKNTNSIKDELVAATRISSHAEGVLDEKTRRDRAG